MRAWITILLIGGFLGGCRLQRLTAAEAKEAVEETQVAHQASALTAASVEISTEFTIGDAVQDAAAQVRSFIHDQLPCADVMLEQASVSVEYGAFDGDCVFNGHRFAGNHTVTVARNEMGDVLVEHDWSGFNNGELRLDGTASVRWEQHGRQRHIVHELVWTRLRDGRMGVGTGDRVQRPLAGGIIEGMQVDGERTWQGDSGHWGMDIDGIQMRWSDPVPQTGRYQVDTPFDKSIALAFERQDEDTIAVTVEGPRRSFTYRVNRIGSITQAD